MKNTNLINGKKDITVDTLSIRQTIADFLAKKAIFQDIDDDQDFFEIGASSLTIVELQIQIEKSLNRSVPTSELMLNPTLSGWVTTYVNTPA